VPDLRVGIDVGGTNTDAVVVDADGSVLTSVKVPTTDDPGEGIAEAAAAIATGGVGQVSMGTTRATNAVVQRRGLRPIGLLRLGSPGTLAIPPASGWPRDLRDAVIAAAEILPGGIEVDGRAVPLDEDAIVDAARRASGAGAASIAIVGTFSVLDHAQEHRARDLVEGATGLPVTLGHEIGGLGLLERENAAALNAALGELMGDAIDALERAAARHFPGATVFLTQNDGTLMRPSFARRSPVLTIGSGPTNSLRGAAALSGRADAVVIDVGGTTTDVGTLVKGFPRESARGVELGGVLTNFRMPDVLSIPVGGGTIIDSDGTLGIASVGNRLLSDALVFGGGAATLTDAAVAAGRASIGRRELIRDGALLIGALAAAEQRVAEAIERMRPQKGDVDAIVVGGGAVLLPDRSPGAGAVVRPPHADVANAVGAALAPVSGQAELVADVAGERRPAAREAVVDAARERAIAAGADPSQLETVLIDEVPLAYLDRPTSRLRAKVAGPPLA
jgi:N-methylhydantoinase A/oxoprolinase/acetone carboxylase beta subunit